MILVVLQSHFSTFESLFIVRKNLPFWYVLICRPPEADFWFYRGTFRYEIAL